MTIPRHHKSLALILFLFVPLYLSADPYPEVGIEPEPEVAYIHTIETVRPWGEDSEGHNLLYLGMHIGWNIQAFAPFWGAERFDGGRFGSLQLAASANLRLLSFQFLDFKFLNSPTPDFGLMHFLGVQFEVTTTQDFGNDMFSLKFPLLLRFTTLWQDMSFSLLTGIYFFVPSDAGQVIQFHPQETLRGNTLGLAFGYRIGPGFATAGLRWSNDVFGTISAATGFLYNRHVVTLSIGYEIGLWRRRPSGE